MLEEVPHHEEAERLRHDQQLLIDHLDALREHVDESTADREGWLDGLADHLDQVTTLLAQYFAVEERSSLFGEFGRRFPRFFQRLQELRHEHLQILAMLEELRTDCLDTVADVAHGALTQRTHTIINMLRRHEREESEILQAAYTDDIGAAD